MTLVHRAVKRVEKKCSLAQKKCIICEKQAIVHIRGLPHDAYCEACAKEYFEDLDYLESL